MQHTAGISRRGFTKLLGVGATWATLQPARAIVPGIAALDVKRAAAGGMVRLSSNENPYGPSPAALTAMTAGFDLAWRYPDEHADMLIDDLAKLNQVTAKQVLLGNGSGEILKLAALAFTGADRKLVFADPTFEAIGAHARMKHAQVVKVPLTADYRHDLERMMDAARDAGLVYICNPNNPTASITPKAEVRSFLAKASPQTVVLIDEAYHHYVETSDYESVIPLTRDFPNLIVARTFSKVYAMAGLRCGYCITNERNIELMRQQQTWDSVNIMAIVAARASLKDTDQVTQGQRRNSEVKRYVCAELDRMGYRYIPSQANFMMIDLRREVRPVIAAMRQHNVEVGRSFPALGNFMRVTIGTRPQMESFLTTFRSVVG